MQNESLLQNKPDDTDASGDLYRGEGAHRLDSSHNEDCDDCNLLRPKAERRGHRGVAYVTRQLPSHYSQSIQGHGTQRPGEARGKMHRSPDIQAMRLTQCLDFDENDGDDSEKGCL
jgi:hypothetical protein